MSEKQVEDVIKEVLKGETQKYASDFISYLRSKDASFEGAENYWEVKYKNEPLCYFFADGSDNKPGPWTIWSDQEPGSWAEDGQVDEQVKKIAWENINVCASCGGECSPGTRKIILGKEFDNLCNSALAFTNPDTDALNCAKKMIDARISGIKK